jgi:hypothetical protein
MQANETPEITTQVETVNETLQVGQPEAVLEEDKELASEIQADANLKAGAHQGAAHGFTLQPWSHPVTKEKRVYVKGGAISPHDKLHVRRIPESGSGEIIHRKSPHPSKQSHEYIAEDLHDFLYGALNMGEGDPLVFEQVWELALIQEAEAATKRKAAAAQRRAEANEKANSVDTTA